jgi:hypothetical protein
VRVKTLLEVWTLYPPHTLHACSTFPRTRDPDSDVGARSYCTHHEYPAPRESGALDHLRPLIHWRDLQIESKFTIGRHNMFEGKMTPKYAVASFPRWQGLCVNAKVVGKVVFLLDKFSLTTTRPELVVFSGGTLGFLLSTAQLCV